MDHLVIWKQFNLTLATTCKEVYKMNIPFSKWAKVSLNNGQDGNTIYVYIYTACIDNLYSHQI